MDRSSPAATAARPTGFDVTVRGIQINAGAGFLVVLTGDILRMPGLPRTPLADPLIVLRNGHVRYDDTDITGWPNTVMRIALTLVAAELRKRIATALNAAGIEPNRRTGGGPAPTRP